MYLQRIDLSIIKKDGYWDEAALAVCEKELEKEVCRHPGRQEAKKIGSRLYRKMFAASRYNALAKAMLPIRQMGGIIDEHGMLQLTRLKYKVSPDTGRIIGISARDNGYCFDEEMEPDSLFLEEYARTIIEAFGRGGLDDPYVHQFRMYIDFHNINYIRTRYEGSSDMRKLKAYAKETRRPLDYGSSSRLHNRKLKKDLGKYEEQVNDKVKSKNGLSEFIIQMRENEYGAAGQFVTQWDYLKINQKTGRINSDPKSYTVEEYKPIVETESFNYCKNDKIRVEGMKKLHTLLDVKPADGRTGYENDLKKEGKKYWAADKVYKEIYRGAPWELQCTALWENA